VTDVHAERERRADEPYEAGYQEGYKEAAYERTADTGEDYVPSDTGYDPAVDGPDDLPDRGQDYAGRDETAGEPPVGADDAATAEAPGRTEGSDPYVGRTEATDRDDADVVDADVVDADVVEGAEGDAVEDGYGEGRYGADADVSPTPSVTDAYEDGTPAATATTMSGPEGALPEDVTPADLAPVAADSVSTVDSAAADTGEPTELVEDPDALLARWQEVQVSFVDDPRESLRTADALVQQVIEDMQQRFLAERAAMEQQWSAGDEVSTEDMRLLLQKYRTFFNRLIRL
jgi:hypothetical protein